MNTAETMMAAVGLLRDLGASWEYPGYIDITHRGIHYAFGDANGPFGGDYALKQGDFHEGIEEEIPNTATPEELAAYIRRYIDRIQRMNETHP